MATATRSPLRIYLMQVGSVGDIPFACYLVQASDGTNILIDSALPDDLQRGPDEPPLVMGPNVVEQLAMLGLQPGDISVLICTHFDFDHAGRHAAFTTAEFIVQRGHYAAAQTDGRFDATRAQWSRPGQLYLLVDGDTELLPGLELIDTSGHVPGHQSVLVRLPATGPVLLTIDAVVDQDNFRPDGHGPFDQDAEGARISTRKLLDLAQREYVALVIFGHDPQQWQTLKKLPEYYG